MPLRSKITNFFSPKNLKKQKTSNMEDDGGQLAPQFPDTLRRFGYHFENGELRHIETGEKFQFVVKEDNHTYNQQHYEALGKVIEECVYELLEKECGLHRLPVPATKTYMSELRRGCAGEPANQTDDAKVASFSGDCGAPAAELSKASSQSHVSAPRVDSTAQSDPSPATEEENKSKNNEVSAETSIDSSSVSATGLDKNSGEETSKESPAETCTGSSSVTSSGLVENSGEKTSEKSKDVQMRDPKAGPEASPSTSPERTDRSGFVFASEGWREKEKLMVLIHGSGVVRAGQWARRLIINDNLDSGTQMPFIKEALRLGYGVVVMNTNQNFVVDTNGFDRSIPGSESPVAHASHVWHHYVMPCAADSIAVVAHSYGGVVVTHLFQEFREHFQDKVLAVAFTDSVHCSPLPRTFGYFMKICRNWVTSSEPLDTPLRSRTPRDVPLVSAGVNSHEMTSSASMKSIFKFFEERLEQRFAMDVDAEEDVLQNELSDPVSDDRNLSDEDKGPQATSVNEVNSSSDQEPTSGVEENGVGEPAEGGPSQQDTA